VRTIEASFAGNPGKEGSGCLIFCLGIKDRPAQFISRNDGIEEDWGEGVTTFQRNKDPSRLPRLPLPINQTDG
jgi:hypothetical protein